MATLGALLALAAVPSRAFARSTAQAALEVPVLDGVSVVAGPDGLGVVSFTGRGLEIAHCATRLCTSGTVATLDGSGFGGSMALAQKASA